MLDKIFGIGATGAMATFARGLLYDILIVAGMTVGAAMVDPDMAFTQAYWVGVGVTLSRTVVATIGTAIRRAASR